MSCHGFTRAASRPGAYHARRCSSATGVCRCTDTVSVRPQGPTGRSKGLLFTAARMFTEQRFGPPAVEACLRQLSASDQEILRSLIPVGWYPLQPTVHYMRVLDATYGKGDLGL